MYTLDTSVWINSFDNREPGHQDSRQLIELLRDNRFSIIVPNFLFIEIGGAISRRHNDQEQAEVFIETIRREMNITSLPLDDELAQQATILAVRQGLRGADAVFAAVAAQENCILISLDHEHLTRLTGVVQTISPTDLLAEFDPQEEES